MFWPNTQGGNSNVHNKEEKTDREQTSNIESVVRITSKSCWGFTHRNPLWPLYQIRCIPKHYGSTVTLTYTLRAYFIEFWGHNN